MIGDSEAGGKVALGSEGSRPFTVPELHGELKEDGETVAGSSSAGSPNVDGSSYRFYLHMAPLCLIGGISSYMAILMAGGCHVLVLNLMPKQSLMPSRIKE